MNRVGTMRNLQSNVVVVKLESYVVVKRELNAAVQLESNGVVNLESIGCCLPRIKCCWQTKTFLLGLSWRSQFVSIEILNRNSSRSRFQQSENSRQLQKVGLDGR
jgi:hypothetical protein